MCDGFFSFSAVDLVLNYSIPYFTSLTGSLMPSYEYNCSYGLKIISSSVMPKIQELIVAEFTKSSEKVEIDLNMFIGYN